MEINMLLEQIRKLEEAVKNLSSPGVQNMRDTVDNFVTDDEYMMETNRSFSPSSKPSSNVEYRGRLRKLRTAYRRELRNLKKEYGVAPRYRAKFSKIKKN